MNIADRECGSVEESLSALLDGELGAAAAAEALEHAFGCASCRDFFLAAKRLQSLAAELAVDPPVGDVQRATPRRIGAGSIRPFLRAAALVTIGLGGGWILSGAPFAAPSGPPAVSGTMTEQRFVALASELMAAEPKYQRTMLEVLRLVPALETGEGLGGPEDSGYVRASTEPARARRGAV